MPSVATRRWDTKAPSTLKRNTPGRWPIEQPHTCPPQGVHSKPVPFFAPSELRQGPLDERAVPVQLEHVETCAVFDEAMDGDADQWPAGEIVTPEETSPRLGQNLHSVPGLEPTNRRVIDVIA